MRGASRELLSRYGIYAFLIASIVAIYGQTYSFSFVNVDDNEYVYDNPHVQTLPFWPSVRWAFLGPFSPLSRQELHTNPACNWHPLTWLSLMVDWRLFGRYAGGYHLVNALLHITSTLVLFEALRRMTGTLWRSALVAALFALHPLRVESVAWVAERKDVLSAMFWMLTMAAYLGYVRRPGVMRYVLVCIFLALGLMAKSMLVTLPFVLLLLDFWPLGRLAPTSLPADAARDLKSRRKKSTARGNEAVREARPPYGWLLVEKAPLLALALCSSALTVLAAQRGGAIASEEFLPISSRTANVVISYVRYLGKILWPANLVFFYPHPQNGWPWWQVAGALVIIVGLSVGIAVFLRKQRYVVVGWLWFLGTLVPVIGVVQAGIQAMADRFTYIPSVGLSLIVSWGAVDLSKRWSVPRQAAAAIAAAVLGILMVLSFIQTAHWRNDESLDRHALACDARNPAAHNNLGVELARRQDYAGAAQEYLLAIDIVPNDPDLHCDLANVYVQMGNAEGAVAEFETAIRLNPDHVKAHNNLGAFYANRKQWSEAVTQYREGLRLVPEWAPLHRNLAWALSQMGRMDEAVVEYKNALDIEPDNTQTRNNLGALFASRKEWPKAIEQFRETLRLDPENVAIRYLLAAAFAMVGQLDAAVSEYTEVLRRAPNTISAYLGLATVKVQQKKSDEALAFFGKAFELEPGNVTIRQELAKLLDGMVHEGKATPAIGFMKSLVARVPGDTKFRMDLVRLLARAGKLHEAAEQCMEILKANPNNCDAHFNLGLINAARGKREEAIASLRKVIELDPNDTAAREALEHLNSN